jgi:hypothetical protein
VISVGPRKYGDAGQAFPIYITVVAGLLFLAFAYFAVGQAAATRNGAQGAADAAALAAAQNARDQLRRGLLDAILTPGSWDDFLNGNGFGTYSGCREAERFADKNGSEVVHCDRLSGFRNGFTVEVKTRYTVGDSIVPGTEDKHAEATATAVIEPRCRFQSPDESPGLGQGQGNGQGSNENPNPDEGEDHKKPILGLKCDGEDLPIDPKNLDLFPHAADLFSVYLAD